MKERPILMNAGMVRAVLDDRKTQTRRIMNPQPVLLTRRGTVIYDDKDWKKLWGELFQDGWFCPYGKVGDQLYVRESHSFDSQMDCVKTSEMSHHEPIFYHADQSIRQTACSMIEPGKTRPSIHMPKWASRIQLEITGIRVERLQDISEEDARHEGLATVTKDGALFKWGIPDRDGLPGTNGGWEWAEWESDTRMAFKKLWESINGPDGWEQNPYVWKVSFKRIDP